MPEVHAPLRRRIDARFAGAAVVALLLTCPAADLSADETAIVESLRAAGGRVDIQNGVVAAVAFQDSSKLEPAHYKQIGQLKSIKRLTLYKTSLTDETLADLGGLENLENVGIEAAVVSDDGMKAMAGWKNLRKLRLFHFLRGKFTGAGVAHLAGLEKLDHFGCGGSSFTDVGFAACAKLKHLKELEIWHTPATDAGVPQLSEMKELRHLYLAPQFTWATRVTDKALEPIAKIKSLEFVRIEETRLTYAEGLKHFKELPMLKTLVMKGTDITPEDLARLKAELPGVDIQWAAPDEQQMQRLRKAFAAKEENGLKSENVKE